jgi:nucleoid DNA-binding protein
MAVKTTSKTKTTAKAKPAKVEAPSEIVAEVVAPRDVLTKKDIIARAVEISGVKKKDARPSVEAALQVVLSALAEGNEVNVPPYGKIRIVKEKAIKGGKMITAKIRINNGSASIPAEAPLAETEE